MVQEYLNEIAPTIYGPNKLKTSGKPLRITDLQPPASGQDKPDTLYIKYRASKMVREGIGMNDKKEGIVAVQFSVYDATP